MDDNGPKNSNMHTCTVRHKVMMTLNFLVCPTALPLVRSSRDTVSKQMKLLQPAHMAACSYTFDRTAQVGTVAE